VSKTKVILRVNTVGAKAGEELEVDGDVAKELVDNGHALRVSGAPKQPKE